MKNLNIVAIILTTVFCLLMFGCSQSMIRGGIANAYSNYDGGDYEDALFWISQVENREGVSHVTKGEMLFLKALTLEKLNRAEESQGIYKYLVEAFSDTEYGYKAKEKLK
jgi:hypothetical protein